jgi:hypothetical protein
MRFVPDLCQTTADMAHLGDLGARKNTNLRVINGRPETDSVPGHHVFNHLQAIQRASWSQNLNPNSLGLVTPERPEETDADLYNLQT